MGLRRSAILLACALLGSAVAVLPAVAGSETAPTIEAVNGGPYAYSWVPPQRTVAPGGSVAFSNPTAVPHGIEWRGVIKPSCSSGVPVGTSAQASATNWSGTCTFTQPGSYPFYCTVHGAAMAGMVSVSSSGETTTTTTDTQPGATTTTTTQPAGTTSAPVLRAGASPPQTAALGAAFIALPRSQHGRVVHGSLQVPGADAGGRLEVDLLARVASLARSPAATIARVGRLARSSVHAGKLSFSVPVNAKGRGALARHRRLALTVKIVLTPRLGLSSSATRRIVLHS